MRKNTGNARSRGEWRNWQTRYVQVVVAARLWRFKSSLAHQTRAKASVLIIKALKCLPDVKIDRRVVVGQYWHV